MARRARMPSGNMEWTRIPPGACVIERRSLRGNNGWYEVKVGRKRYVAFWGSRDAAEAQRTLTRLARRPCRS